MTEIVYQCRDLHPDHEWMQCQRDRHADGTEHRALPNGITGQLVRWGDAE